MVLSVTLCQARGSDHALLLVALLSRNIVFGENCKPKDCVDLKCYRVSTAKDGPHTIYPGTPNLPTLQVSCDQATVGDGWIVLMRRVDGSVNFSRTWTEYRNGFGQHGDESTELWLGNENVHQMVNSYGNTKCELRLEGYAFDGTSCIITSGNFRLRNENRRYAVAFDSVGADSMPLILDWANHFGSYFRTIDNTFSDKVCFPTYTGGWWYGLGTGDCHNVYFTGKYHSKPSPTRTSIYIEHFKGHMSLKGCVMLFRPVDHGYRHCNNPCKKGTCEYLAATDNHRCVCPTTHCGASCEVKNVCENNGTCVNNSTTNNITCECVAGFTGPTCSEKVTTAATTSLAPIFRLSPIILIGIIIFYILLIAGIAAMYFIKRQHDREDEEQETERQRLLEEQKAAEEDEDNTISSVLSIFGF
ncbi:Angiopoietin-4 [Lamellibrachia satsuma]|nr:Angiopoietin-4 [Lamellibrachia satsuma]